MSENINRYQTCARVNEYVKGVTKEPRTQLYNASNEFTANEFASNEVAFNECFLVPVTRWQARATRQTAEPPTECDEHEEEDDGPKHGAGHGGDGLWVHSEHQAGSCGEGRRISTSRDTEDVGEHYQDIKW